MPTALTAAQALDRLRRGNARWATSRATGERRTAERRAEAALGQTPYASVLACADSRVAPEFAFDEGVGDLFVVRTAGQVIDAAVHSSLVFGVDVLKTPVVVVMGHSGCGAVAAVRSCTDSPASLSGVISAIGPEVVAAESAEAALEIHVRDTVEALTDLNAEVVGAIYDTASGEVRWL